LRGGCLKVDFSGPRGLRIAASAWSKIDAVEAHSPIIGDHALEAEPLGYPAFASFAPGDAESAIARDLDHRCGEPRRTVPTHEPARDAVLDLLRHPADIGGDDGQTGAHRFPPPRSTTRAGSGSIARVIPGVSVMNRIGSALRARTIGCASEFDVTNVKLSKGERLSESMSDSCA
jgi:hypothetical protein